MLKKHLPLNVRVQRRALRLELLEARSLLASDAITGLAVIGDALSDEYAGTTRSPARAWTELLVQQRSLDLGVLGNYDEPRRSGYEFNWAREGSNSNAVLVQGQDFSVVQQIVAGDVSHVVFSAGLEDLTEFDDFSQSIPFESLYNAAWDAADIDNFKLSSRFGLEALLGNASSVRSSIVAATIPDPSVFPKYRNSHPDAAKRSRVSAMVSQLNEQIRELAQTYHVVLADLGGLMGSLLGTNSALKTSVQIGGRNYANAGGASASNLFTASGFHPHTALQAVMANLYLEAFNVGYGHTFQKFTEAEINTLTGQTFANNTLNVNYSSFITIPQLSVYLDFGGQALADNFTSRLNEMATANSISAFTAEEVEQLRGNVKSQLKNVFSGLRVDFPDNPPTDTRVETVLFGRTKASLGASTTTPYSNSPTDWLNADEQQEGHVFVDALVHANLRNLTRANQLKFVTNFLAFYAAQNITRQFGLDQADAYASLQVTSANYSNLNSVQLLDYNSGNPALGFNLAAFESPTDFRISQLGLAKLQFSNRVHPQPRAPGAEAAGAHATPATAQALPLAASAVGGVKTALVQGGALATSGEVDYFSFTAAAGELITAQIYADGLYNPGAAIDATLRLYAADGVTLLAASDDTFLGANSFGDPATTRVDRDALILNFVAPSSGTYLVQVAAKNLVAGSYDLFVAASNPGFTQWQNQAWSLDVNNDRFVTGLDAVIVVNELNARTIIDDTGRLPNLPGPQSPPPFYDVNADRFLTGLDAVIIVSYLNSDAFNGEGEARDEPAPAAASTNPADAWWWLFGDEQED